MKSLGSKLMSFSCLQRKAGRKSVKKDASSSAVPWMWVLGWSSIATGTLAVGYLVGRNLRARYLLHHRTPYDFYSHAGDNGNGMEYGVGI
jgi:hypothetical protein